MGIEIERKFLVLVDDWRPYVTGSERIRQGYLANTDRCSIRVRIQPKGASLTIKSATGGSLRREFEYGVPMADANLILAELCGGRHIEKVRRRVPHGTHIWVIDEFAGANSGLVLAEIELASTDEKFLQPAWLGPEVTKDTRYLNANLAARPFSTWSYSDREEPR